MHSGSRHVVMSLLQNYILRNSIDRGLLLTVSATGGGQRRVFNRFNNSIGGQLQERSIFTSMAFRNGPGSQSNGEKSVPPEAPPLDPEALAKLNQLKDGLQSKNEYFEKYKEKLQKLESSAPRELLARLEQLEDEKKDHLTRMKMADKATRKPRSLNDVMHMDSLRNLDRCDIINLWQEFHRHKEGLMAAVMARSVYEKMKDLASVHKMFVMPLPRPDGYEFFFMQFEDNTFHFTPLIAYQTHQESAPVSLRLINYIDLQHEKDLVLLRGEYDHKSMKAEDAHFLAVQTNFYYGETNESRLALLDKFSKEPQLFNHVDLIEELKKIQETHAQLFEFESTAKASSPGSV